MSILFAVSLAAIAAAMPPPLQEGKSGAAATRRVALSAAEGAALAARVLAHPDLPQRAQGHRLAAIRVTAEETADGGKTIVTVVLFDHTAREARRIRLDGATNRLLLNELLPGRPQRSDGELADAIGIVRRDPGLAGLFAEGAVLDGGFIVEDPDGSRRRMIQMKLMSADRRMLLRTIVVDLTGGRIALVGER